ncbi:MAG: DUF6427 family protein [Mangrovibacterium sp.]|nr:DUF6427 family protein [Mangrovibacterium sp.]
MILRFLKSNHPVHFILIPLVVSALWVRSFISPRLFPFFPGENKMPLYNLVDQLLSGLPLVQNVLAVVFVILLSFMILHLNTVYDFIQIRTFLPSTIFVLIVSGLLDLHTLHPVYFGTVFFLLSIYRIFHASENKNAGAIAFDAGFWLAVASLFYLKLIFYFPVIWAGLILLWRKKDWRDFVMSLTGMLLPWLFTFSWYFLTGTMEELREVVVQNVITPNSFFHDNLPFRIYLAFLTLVTLWCSLFLLGQYDAKKSSTRRYFKIFFLIFLISLVLYFLVPASSQEILAVMAVPLTFLISNYLITMKSSFWGNVFILIFLGLVLYMQSA